MSKLIHGLLDCERSIIDSRQIFIGGSGQGGAMAIHAALRYPHSLAGIISVGGYVALPSEYSDGNVIQQAQKQTPLLVVHGGMDTAVPWAAARERYKVLEKKLSLEIRTEFTMGTWFSNTQLLNTFYWVSDTHYKNMKNRRASNS
jgi:phospholipase/carboxylesterase